MPDAQEHFRPVWGGDDICVLDCFPYCWREGLRVWCLILIQMLNHRCDMNHPHSRLLANVVTDGRVALMEYLVPRQWRVEASAIVLALILQKIGTNEFSNV